MWTEYLKLVGEHYYSVYAGIVDDAEQVHKRETLSTFGTRTSVKGSLIIIVNDENQPGL